MKVLVADDSTVMRMVIIKMLREKYDFEHREADDGGRAVELYKEYRPDLVTLDINMAYPGRTQCAPADPIVRSRREGDHGDHGD